MIRPKYVKVLVTVSQREGICVLIVNMAQLEATNAKSLLKCWITWMTEMDWSNKQKINIIKCKKNQSCQQQNFTSDLRSKELNAHTRENLRDMRLIFGKCSYIIFSLTGKLDSFFRMFWNDWTFFESGNKPAFSLSFSAVVMFTVSCVFNKLYFSSFHLSVGTKSLWNVGLSAHQV